MAPKFWGLLYMGRRASFYQVLCGSVGDELLNAFSGPGFESQGLGTMGAGGRTHAPATRKSAETDNFKRAPHLKPPFTFGQLKKAIPPHCFQRSLIRSFSYLVHDFAIASIFLYIASNYINNLSAPLSFLAWPIYWALQGSVLMGVWVLAHECGHNAFSDYQWLDDTLGLVLHSFLLAPYFSWKYSHRRHHSNAASLERDENYVPKRKSDMESYFKYRHNLPGRVLGLAVTLILGWYMYLASNVYGRPYDGFACHFHPYSPIYSDRERLQIYISDAGVLAVCYGLYRLAVAKGLAWVLCFYGGPLMVVNSFLVLITYLHHIHPSLPHYDSSEWDWLRGALSTVDRDYGILTKVFHNITDTHVAHHLFSSIPHYHAMEATNAIKPILGDYYQFDATPFYKAIWREAKECIYVEPDEVDKKGVYWYKNKP